VPQGVSNEAGVNQSIAFIGAGRLATALATALVRHGHHVTAVASRSPASAQRLAAALRDCRATSMQEAARADLVFLTVSDDAIEPLASSLDWRAGQHVVHCSGATEVDALARAAAHGALTGGFHPVVSFSDPALAVERLAGSTVSIEGPPPLLERLRQMAALLGMHTLVLPPGVRALYHGSISFAASFLLAMLKEAVDVWKSFGIDEAAALRALLPVSRGNLDSAARNGLTGALAGPFSRGDAGVIACHLEALDRLGAQHGALYRELSRRQLLLVEEAGRLDEIQLQRMRDLIKG
jgi:predicted short-subunit dehydrogenase-like oxidoreductase (DUF2520 family)